MMRMREEERLRNCAIVVVVVAAAVSSIKPRSAHPQIIYLSLHLQAAYKLKLLIKTYFQLLKLMMVKFDFMNTNKWIENNKGLHEWKLFRFQNRNCCLRVTTNNNCNCSCRRQKYNEHLSCLLFHLISWVN